MTEYHGDTSDLMKEAQEHLERTASHYSLDIVRKLLKRIEALEAEVERLRNLHKTAFDLDLDAATRRADTAETVVEATRQYMKIHKGPWPRDTAIYLLGKALDVHDEAQKAALKSTPNEKVANPNSEKE